MKSYLFLAVEAVVLRSHIDLFWLNALGSDLPLLVWICSRDAQLDCFNITEDGDEDTSEVEDVVTLILGTGLGAEVIEAIFIGKETLSRGRAPLVGNVLL